MKFNYIVIEREYASGGSDIGKKAAEILDIPCYGREIPEITAKKSGISFDRIMELEENATGSLLYSLSRMTNFMRNNPANLNAFESVVIEEMKVIRELSENGPAVFVGRAASKGLGDRKDVLKVFIHASMDFREHRAVKSYGICRSEVRETIRNSDRRRSVFYKANFGNDWKQYGDYDVVLDSSVVGIDQCAAAIAECVK
ncbi:MAG: AAA family ATPase [Porcipelethomonas sp.]